MLPQVSEELEQKIMLHQSTVIIAAASYRRLMDAQDEHHKHRAAERASAEELSKYFAMMSVGGLVNTIDPAYRPCGTEPEWALKKLFSEVKPWNKTKLEIKNSDKK